MDKNTLATLDLSNINVTVKKNIIIKLVLFLLSLLVLVLLAFIFYFIYLMIVYYYPRPYFIGHSEPLEQFIKGYIPELLITMKQLKEINPGVLGNALELKSTYKGLKGKPLFPIEANDPTDPNEAPFLYLYFALGSDYNNKSVVGISGKLVPGCELADKLTEETFFDPVPSEFKKDIEAIDQAIDKIKDKVKNTWKSKDFNKLHEMNLAILIDKKRYIQTINNMYDFRKSGGLGNITLLRITMMDYIKYVWLPPKGVVPHVWMSFVTDLQDKVGGFRDWLRSPKVSSFFMKLPATIGGVETFQENRKTPNRVSEKIEEFIFLGPQHTKPGDTIEEFGFLKGLLGIPKSMIAMVEIFKSIGDFFQTIMAVAMALVNAITNPIAVLRMIIGMVVGVLFLILYFVILAIDVVLYIPGAIVIAAIDVWKTIWAIFLFILIASFYLVIWVLDMVTGGLFLKIMRCENLPNKWYLQPGYFFDNKFVRGFMCNFTCSSRFIPSDDGSWCERLKRGRPSYCPQQIIYNAARSIITGATNPVINGNSSDNKLLYKFVIPSSYYGMDEVSKKTKIVEYLKDKNEYIKKCFKFNSEFASIAIASCNYFNSLKSADRSIDPAKYKIYEDNKELVEKALKICVACHCNLSFPQQKDTGKLNFCPPPSEEPLEEITDDSADGKTIAHRVIFSSLALTIIMTIIAAMYFYTRDKTFSFVKLLTR